MTLLNAARIVDKRKSPNHTINWEMIESAIYKHIAEGSKRLTVEQLCQELNITASTYYRYRPQDFRWPFEDSNNDRLVRARAAKVAKRANQTPLEPKEKRKYTKRKHKPLPVPQAVSAPTPQVETAPKRLTVMIGSPEEIAAVLKGMA